MRLLATHRVMLEITLMLRILSPARLPSVGIASLVQLSFSGMFLPAGAGRRLNEVSADVEQAAPSPQNINPSSLDKQRGISHKFTSYGENKLEKTFGLLTFVGIGKKKEPIIFPSHPIRQPFDPVWKCPDAPTFHTWWGQSRETLPFKCE